MTGLVVHEWAEIAGGSENVVDAFLEMFPGAHLQVLWNNAPRRFERQVHETWLARTPLRRHKSLALPFMPPTWRQLNHAERFDWILVSSHLFAHHVRLRRQTGLPKLVYAHTPARYIWEPDLDTRGDAFPARIAAAALKPLDKKRSAEALSIAANSQFTRQRIERTWGREAVVIHPPVDTERIAGVASWPERLSAPEQEWLGKLPDAFILGASRFVAYKRLELVIRAGVANGLPVVLAGSGPDEARLRAIAADSEVPVFFATKPSNELLFSLFQTCVAYIFPAIEDFGIMPVEAMACGSPVIVPETGGARESVDLLHGGAIFRADTLPEWRRAVQESQRVARTALRNRTATFSIARFKEQTRRWMGEHVDLNSELRR